MDNVFLKPGLRHVCLPKMWNSQCLKTFCCRIRKELYLVGCSFPVLRFIPSSPLNQLLLCLSSHSSRSLLSTSALLSSPPPGSPSPHPPFASVRFVLWLQRLNLLAKHTKLLSCKSTQVQEGARKKREPRTLLTIPWASEHVSGALHLVRNYGE